MSGAHEMSGNEFQTDGPATEKVRRSNILSRYIPRYDKKSTTFRSQMLSAWQTVQTIVYNTIEKAQQNGKFSIQNSTRVGHNLPLDLSLAGQNPIMFWTGGGCSDHWQVIYTTDDHVCSQLPDGIIRPPQATWQDMDNNENHWTPTSRSLITWSYVTSGHPISVIRNSLTSRDFFIHHHWSVVAKRAEIIVGAGRIAIRQQILIFGL